MEQSDKFSKDNSCDSTCVWSGYSSTGNKAGFKHETGAGIPAPVIVLSIGKKEEICMPTKPPLPPFSAQTAAEKVQMAEDAWNSKDPISKSPRIPAATIQANSRVLGRGRGSTGVADIAAVSPIALAGCTSQPSSAVRRGRQKDVYRCPHR